MEKISFSRLKRAFGMLVALCLLVAPLVIAWELDTASYDSKSVSVGTQDGTVFDVAFNDDGTIMYILGYDSDTIYQYTVSTPWDVSTASYASKSLSVNAKESVPEGFFFKPDGTQVYVTGVNTDAVHQYTMSTPWDISTATFTATGADNTSNDNTTTKVFFSDDGTKLFLTGFINARIYQYSLSSAWDVTTASYDSVSGSVSHTTNTYGSTFKADGTKVYAVGGNDIVYQYSLSSAWDMSTISYDSVSLNVSGQDTNAYGIYFRPNGSKFYMAGAANNSVFQYSVDADSEAPTVSTFSPLDGASEVGTTDNLIMTFSETVDAESGNITIYEEGGSIFEAIDVTSGQVTGSGSSTITINPSDEFVPGVSYYVQVASTAFDDESSNSYAGISDTTTWNFSVPGGSRDREAPVLQSLSPANGAQSVSSTAILSMTFSEDIYFKNGNVELYREDGTLLEQIYVHSEQVEWTRTNVVNIHPNTELEAGESYYVLVTSSAFSDARGNMYQGIAESDEWSFTIEAAVQENEVSEELISESTEEQESASTEYAFWDTIGHDFAAAIQSLWERGIVSGYPHEKGPAYKPDQLINRAEFLKIAMLSAGQYAEVQSPCFEDVVDQWFASYICHANSLAIVSGYEDGSFYPERHVNLAEALKIIFRAYGHDLGQPISGPWYGFYLEEAESLGLLKGIGNLDVSASITRAEMAELIRLMEEF